MGTDIHISIQRRSADGLAWDDVRWQRVWSWQTTPPLPDVPVAPEAFSSRNYNLFGILANVRNGSGFAGCLTGSGWPSIAADRGIPPDMPELKPDDDGSDPEPDNEPRWLGDHSYSWVTLAELDAFDWDHVEAWLYGVVTEVQYEKFIADREQPDQWSGGISGPGIEVYEPDVYEARKTAGTLAPRPYIRIGWPRTARQATYGWPSEVLPWLHTLSEGRELRLVFGFDS